VINLSLDALTKGYRDKELISKLAGLIKKEASNNNYRFMHVCGTHEDTITKTA